MLQWEEWDFFMNILLIRHNNKYLIMKTSTGKNQQIFSQIFQKSASKPIKP